MTAIARALEPRHRSTGSKTSDTPRLDAELLMAHALGIERDTPVAVEAGRSGAGGLRRLHRAPAGRRAGRLYHRQARLLEHRAGSRARRAGAASGQRDVDRRRRRAFRRHAGAEADPRPRHRAGHVAAGGARPMAEGDRDRRRFVRRGARLCPAQREAARPRGARPFQARRLGQGDQRNASTSS